MQLYRVVGLISLLPSVPFCILEVLWIMQGTREDTSKPVRS